MDNHELRAVASRALSLLDLTNLKDDCTPEQIVTLCGRAQSVFGPTAAICIWPRFVMQARTLLGPDSPIRIATVVNFPSGEMKTEDVLAETRDAVADGADDIDLVIPYRAFAKGDEKAVSEMVAAVKGACGPAILKTILETGELKDIALIRRASDLAIAAGADFIKTSTGKVGVNATLEAADIMLQAIRDSRKNVGFKPAGGISTVADAALYLSLADTIMGEDWVMPSTFRFGASGLLDNILAVLSGERSTAAASGY
ncbi:deoxyribose-phosphate aldolase [Peteryoungia aggregata LMG 23059]|uniref:Deoxyribose-phosphate aldolase n=1 Tax=Peteryoungia aggregata LMG 23059 TaxID=1368425 RepID=A0ABU0G5U4_9HYPH|nr:deoxyribose-phosphate aldolase [Peteryoungia aggregata]MDQ0420309.1 deoxyribose-phosphate aldolase [Peteryoungia aggregata LMG 23059]